MIRPSIQFSAFQVPQSTLLKSNAGFFEQYKSTTGKRPQSGEEAVMNILKSQGMPALKVQPVSPQANSAGYLYVEPIKGDSAADHVAVATTLIKNAVPFFFTPHQAGGGENLSTLSVFAPAQKDGFLNNASAPNPFFMKGNTEVRFGGSYRENYAMGDWLKAELNKQGVYPFVFAGTVSPEDKPSLRFYASNTVNQTIEKCIAALATLPNVTASPADTSKPYEREFVVENKGTQTTWLVGLVEPHNLHGG